MAKPNLKFVDVDDPYKLRCGERRILKMQIKARAVGMCKLKLFLKAETCFFGGGSKEIVTEFNVADTAEKRDLEIKLVMMGSRPITYTLNLNAVVENADGEKNDDFLLVKLDCRNPMSDEEQTVDFDEAPLTTVTAPVSHTAAEHADAEEGTEEDETRDSDPEDESAEADTEAEDDDNEEESHETDEESDTDEEEENDNL